MRLPGPKSRSPGDEEASPLGARLADEQPSTPPALFSAPFQLAQQAAETGGLAALGRGSRPGTCWTASKEQGRCRATLRNPRGRLWMEKEARLPAGTQPLPPPSSPTHLSRSGHLRDGARPAQTPPLLEEAQTQLGPGVSASLGGARGWMDAPPEPPSSLRALMPTLFLVGFLRREDARTKHTLHRPRSAGRPPLLDAPWTAGTTSRDPEVTLLRRTCGAQRKLGLPRRSPAPGSGSPPGVASYKRIINKKAIDSEGIRPIQRTKEPELRGTHNLSAFEHSTQILGLVHSQREEPRASAPRPKPVQTGCLVSRSLLLRVHKGASRELI
uniref:Uncharacterized protein n=1 Tax=Sphaerodactylus townsendi TaxID=933632 RepID=A0ACB8EZY9_9SAUR